MVNKVPTKKNIYNQKQEYVIRDSQNAEIIKEDTQALPLIDI